jgi:hypothetical protein
LFADRPNGALWSFASHGREDQRDDRQILHTHGVPHVISEWFIGSLSFAAVEVW